MQEAAEATGKAAPWTWRGNGSTRGRAALDAEAMQRLWQVQGLAEGHQPWQGLEAGLPAATFNGNNGEHLEWADPGVGDSNLVAPYQMEDGGGDGELGGSDTSCAP